jgi:hypothetical protein
VAKFAQVLARNVKNLNNSIVIYLKGEIDTANSGKLVPSAIILKPMIKSDISKNIATSTPPHTINFALEINTIT